jgi:hypothetical protein
MLKNVLALAALALGATAAQAGDMAHYRGKCKAWMHQASQFDYWCDVAVGPETAEAKVVVFLVKPPGDAPEIRVRAFRNKSATVDGVPAHEVAIMPGWFHFVTSEGLDLRFAKPPAGIEF